MTINALKAKKIYSELSSDTFKRFQNYDNMFALILVFSEIGTRGYPGTRVQI